MATAAPAFGSATTARSSATAAVPGLAVRFVGVLLALAVSAIHIADQGGISTFDSPDWLGWAYRIIEVRGVLTALALLASRARGVGWVAALLLGIGPFIGYVVSRTVGVPGDPQDVGNWGYWVGTVSLVVEAALVVLSVGMLLERVAARGGMWRRTLPGGSVRCEATD